jgi:hypothetical protein
VISQTKRLLWIAQRARPLAPGHMAYLQAHLGGLPAGPINADEVHLRAAADWLAAAQDSQGDGGVSGRYRLASGWTSSYPETTGYIAPTMLALANRLGEPAWKERAARAVRFLLDVQLDGGAFPGGEIAENRTEPSPFNSAQIIHGLNAWVTATGDAQAAEAARRAAGWLVGVQDPDGAFRKHYYWTPAAYSAHLSCWLAEHGRLNHDAAALAAAGRHLDWVMTLRDTETGWFDHAGFTEEEHKERRSVTHTIAYTLWGVLLLGVLLDRPDAIAAARDAAERIMRRLHLSKRLPAWLDHRWKPAHAAQCLTGNAQMALIWFKLDELEPDARMVNAAVVALDQVKAAQDLDNPNPGLRGGIAGSFPVWGDYIPMAVPNWAAKYFIDALLAKEAALARLERTAA